MIHSNLPYGYTGFDYAIVCENGHTINSAVNDAPEWSSDYCRHCGKAAITMCPSCEEPIQGAYYIEGSRVSIYEPPPYCRHCGAMFPWTRIAIDAVKEFILEASEVEQDTTQIAESLAELSGDTPRTPVAALRIRKVIGKLGEKFQDTATDLIAKFATEMATKAIKGEI